MESNMFSLSFLHERALDPGYRLSASERGIVEMAKDALATCNAVVVCLGGKAGRLGETIVATGLLEATLQALRSTGKADTPVSIIVDEEVATLFDEHLYRQTYWPQINIIQVPPGTSQDISRIIGNYAKGNHILALDFHGSNDGMPYLQFEEEEKP
jgi:hypothetical protein